MFRESNCPYSATAIEAVKEMQDFEVKSFVDKSKVVMVALHTKHP
jgi:hypothetical protein